MISNSRHALIVILFDIAAMSARKSIYHNTKRIVRVRNERLNYVMNYYSSNQKAAIMGTAPSACYLSLLMSRNHHCIHAAAK
jgi:hypothetical protein